MPKPLLYHNEMSVCAAKVRVLLARKGIAWDGRLLDLRAGEAQAPEYVALNPNQVVPTLVVGEDVVIESNVILEYVEDRWPTPSARPEGAGDRARMRLWMRQLDEGVHAATGAASVAIAFRHQFLARPPEDLRRWLENIRDPVRRARAQAGIELGMEAPQFSEAVWRFLRLFDEIEATLARGPWLAGPAPSLADYAFAPYMQRFVHLGFGALVAGRPRLADWAGRLARLPEVEAGVTAWFKPEVLAIFARERPAAEARIATIAAQQPE